MIDVCVWCLFVVLVEIYIFKWKIFNWVFEVRKKFLKCELKFILYRLYLILFIVKNMIN